MRAGTGFVVGVLAIVVGSSPVQVRADLHAQSQSALAIDRIKEWVSAVETHQPGEVDAAALRVATFSHADLSVMFAYLEALLELVESPTKDDVRHSPSPLLWRPLKSDWAPPPRVSEADVHQLRALASLKWIQDDRNRLLKGGAMLHADIAMMVDIETREFTPPPGATRASVARLGWSATQRVVAYAPDADYRGLQYGVVHWDVARTLLDAVTPAPSSDGFVRDWYRATAAYFTGGLFFGEAKPHFDHAFKLFPADAELLFSHACMQVAMASPGVQQFVQATRLPGNVRFDVSSARTHLRVAEQLFRRALEIQPRMAEARVRLAHVRSAQGEHEEAAALLTEAVALATEPVVAYYAQLFVGETAVAQGHDEVARIAFGRAAELFPAAQTPRLALSRLARSGADGAGAIAALTPLFTLGADPATRHDPWWDFHRGEGRYAETLFAALRILYEGQKR
jgi:tetratricopeptide (TPR) repeat protein